MGAAHSNSKNRANGNDTHAAANGYRSDATTDSSNGNDDCRIQPCFFLPSLQSKNNNPMGSPIPDTPRQQRQRRHMEQKHRQHQHSHQQTPASAYAGLEREVVRTTPLPTDNGNNGIYRDAEIHEGPDADIDLQQKYQLMEPLGVGSTSTCHRCIERATGRTYACKVIDKRLIEDRFQGMMTQFRTEIDALRSLHHPGIIQLFDVYSSNDKISIVMELMEGGELFDYVVEKGTLTEEEAAKIVRKVTSALVYMHSKNIVHRDLKPENLLLKKPPRPGRDEIDVKIIDFGLSKFMQEPVARSFLGTRGYLAPEMLQRREYTRAVDTWALGVIVFVLLCGCLPFDDDSQTVPSDDLVRAKFVLRFPRWAKNLSPSAKDLLGHLLDINPATRFTAEQALAHPWVTGKEAPKTSQLASPGRIKKSPVLRNRAPQGGRVVNGSHHHGRGGHHHHQSRGTMSTPPRVLVRKTSI